MFSGTHITANTGRLYTDTRGRVVFADQGFADLFRGVTPANPIGKPLHEVLGIEQNAAHVLLKVHGEEQRDLLLRKPGMPPGASVLCTCRAATNAFGKVFGANLLFSRTTGASRAIQYQPDRARLESYFTEQLDSLQVLVGRVGGRSAADAGERLQPDGGAERMAYPIEEWAAGVRAAHRPGADLQRSAGGGDELRGQRGGPVAGDCRDAARSPEVDDRTRQLAEQFGLRDLFFGRISGR
jgi:hypothetical protein